MKNIPMLFKLPILLIVAVLIPSCSESEEIRSEQLLEQDVNLKTITYLALGDSYTVGESVAYTDSFPAQLSQSIESNLNYKVNTTVIAQTGWRTDQLIAAVGNRKSTNYNLVTLLIGVNNQFQSKPFSLYETEFPYLLEKAIDLSDGDSNKVVVVSIPDYFFTPYGQANSTSQVSIEIDQYNNYVQSVAKSKGVTFLNITDITRKGIEQPELVTEDGLHPSGIAYEKFVERLYPLVLSRLKD